MFPLHRLVSSRRRRHQAARGQVPRIPRRLRRSKTRSKCKRQKLTQLLPKSRSAVLGLHTNVSTGALDGSAGSFDSLVLEAHVVALRIGQQVRLCRCGRRARAGRKAPVLDLFHLPKPPKYRSWLIDEYASAARAFISPTAFEQARGGALGAGGGRVGFAGGGLF